MSHTPGPWEAVYGHQSGLARGVRAERANIVNFGGISRPAKAEGQANARLIAAAPDLADVAHMVLNTATVYTPPELVQAATEALRKAGEVGG